MLEGACMNPYNKPKEGDIQSCRKCRWIRVCVDPCDDCENMDVVDGNGNLLPGKEYCPFEQGSKECRKLAGKTCQQYEPKLQSSVDLEVIRCLESRQ
jgi:hypothetical protein